MKRDQSLSLHEIAEYVGGQVRGSGDVRLNGIASLDAATQGDITYAMDKYLTLLGTCQAGAVILSDKGASQWSGAAVIVKDPYLAYAKLTQLFVKAPTRSGIHASAIIDETAHIDETAIIGPRVVIGAHASIGPHTVIDAGVVVEDGVKVGSHCRLYPNVVLYHDVMLHDRVIVHAGAVIGSDGFGFAEEHGRFVKIAQLGTVIVEDDVEIGACTTIDRGALKPTKIGKGVKLDNQIQIAHNVEIGEHTAIAGQAGIAGSTKIGKFCRIGGATCIGGHLNICDHVYITGMSMVTKSLTQPGLYSSGIPVRPNGLWRKNVARFQRLGLSDKK